MKENNTAIKISEALPMLRLLCKIYNLRWYILSEYQILYKLYYQQCN